MANRLATVAPNGRRSALAIVLEHLEDAHPEEHATALAMLADETAYGHTQIADALTRIAVEDRLGVRVNEKGVRDYRKAAQTAYWQQRAGDHEKMIKENA